MPDITLSPIPYNGGALNMTNQSSHICQLTANKFFSLFGQTNPNYTFASTINIDNLKATTPIATVGKQRVMNQVALTRARTWKLSNNRVLALMNTDLVVFEVQGDDDIVQKAATLPAFHSTVLWGTEAASVYGIGTFLHGQYIKDNVVWMIQRTTTTSAITLLKIEYNPETDTLSRTTIATIAASTTATHFWRFSIQQIPGTTDFFVHALGANTTPALATITGYWVINDQGTVTTSVSSGIPTTARYLVPLKANKILALSDARTWRYFDGSSWTTVDTVFAPAVTATTSLVHVEPLDENYFMVESTSAAVEIGSGNYAFRVSRVVDPSFGQTSPATSAANGLAYPVTNAYFDQRPLFKVDDDTFIALGRASATAFRIRILSNS